MKNIRRLVIILCICILSTSVSFAATPKREVKLVNTNACYTELNKYRKDRKITVLKKDKNLEKIAKIRAKEMAETGKFSHTRPNGKRSLTLIKGNKAKGENIAMGFRDAKSVTRAWYESKGHRDNMLRKKFKKIGIAAYEYNGIIYWCQIYSS